MPNPFLDRAPRAALRDPATFFHDDHFHCFHTVVEHDAAGYRLYVDVVKSRDLSAWSAPRRLTQTGLNFSSPGNVIRVGEDWVLCVQSYPTSGGSAHGNDNSRLWTMKSRDGENWDAPVLLQPAGCQANWCQSRRQIDPYLVEHDGQFWCFYKSEGQLGVLVSPDLKTWREARPDHPVLSASQTPDGSTVENPCVIGNGDEFILFFAPCRQGRGIGLARSTDLVNWRDVGYLDFPDLPWAAGGPTAAMVLETNHPRGRWTMFFHGDREAPHGAALGLAWSDDLLSWRCD